MKRIRRMLSIFLVVIMLMTCADFAALAEAVLTLPKALKIIEEEAFYGDQSIDKVVVPDGTTEIRSKAFANSSLKEIELPDSVKFIAPDALPPVSTGLTVTVNKDIYAYNWAVDHGYIEASSTLEITNVGCSVDGIILLNSTVLWAVSVEADSNVQYEFVLLRQAKEIARQDYGSKNFFRYTLSKSGDYTLKITCRDGQSLNNGVK